jgi:sulfoxide reductase heme-binding subunit YedZ
VSGASAPGGPGLLIGGTAALLAIGMASAGITYGFSEEAVRSVIRSTAQIAVVLFVLAFSASSLQTLLRAGWTKWLLRNRRWLGLSFALAHFVHLFAIGALWFWFPEPFVADLEVTTLIFGGIAYVFLLALALTSTDAAQQKLGGRNWRMLHTVGSYYIWLIFALSYLPRAFEEPLPSVFFALIVIAPVALRTARRITMRSVHRPAS